MRIVISLLLLSATAFAFDSTYTEYAQFLGRNVCKGGVAYDQIGNDTLWPEIQKDFETLSRTQFEAMKKDNQIAYLINAYNFYTIILIHEKSPQKSIKDIPAPWSIKFINLLGDKVSLDFIEHEMLRKNYAEPRIHFGLVCASRSCPALSEKPFEGKSLRSQLNDAAKVFLMDTTRNRHTGSTAEISKIFDWYGDDFKKIYKGGYKEYIAHMWDVPKIKSAKFLEYDWNLNKVDGCE